MAGRMKRKIGNMGTNLWGNGWRWDWVGVRVMWAMFAWSNLLGFAHRLVLGDLKVHTYSRTAFLIPFSKLGGHYLGFLLCCMVGICCCFMASFGALDRADGMYGIDLGRLFWLRYGPQVLGEIALLFWFFLAFVVWIWLNWLVKV